MWLGNLALPFTGWPRGSMGLFWPCFPFCRIEKGSVPTSQSSVRRIWETPGEQGEVHRNWSVRNGWYSTSEIDYQSRRMPPVTVGFFVYRDPADEAIFQKMPHFLESLLIQGFGFPGIIAFCSYKKPENILIFFFFFFKWGNWAPEV